MSKVAELLEQKQTLLERMQEQPGPDQLAEIERGLKEINEALNEIESEELDDAPIAPYWPSRPMVARQPACRSTATRLAAQVLSSRLARTRLARCATVDHRKARLADG